MTQAVAQQTDLPSHQRASLVVPVDEVCHRRGYDQVCLFVYNFINVFTLIFRKDHSDVSNQLYACYAIGKDVQAR